MDFFSHFGGGGWGERIKLDEDERKHIANYGKIVEGKSTLLENVLLFNITLYKHTQTYTHNTTNEQTLNTQYTHNQPYAGNHALHQRRRGPERVYKSVSHKEQSHTAPPFPLLKTSLLPRTFSFLRAAFSFALHPHYIMLTIYLVTLSETCSPNESPAPDCILPRQ